MGIDFYKKSDIIVVEKEKEIKKMVVDFGFENIENDPLNLDGLRNLRNTDKGWYNCGGYALETFSWYMPYDGDEVTTFSELFETYEEWDENDDPASTVRERIEDYMVEQLLQDFPTLRLIPDEIECRPSERLIAFRVGFDDFHFLKKAKNNCWYQKRGASSRIERIRKSEVFGESWNGRYDGRVFLFAIRA